MENIYRVHNIDLMTIKQLERCLIKLEEDFVNYVIEYDGDRDVIDTLEYKQIIFERVKIKDRINYLRSKEWNKQLSLF